MTQADASNTGQLWQHSRSLSPTLLSSPDAVLVVTAIADAVLALGAFVLSFDALRELAVVAGLRLELAWIWPVIVDGFIVVATINAIVLSERSSKAAWYPWAALLGFAVVSVIGNGLHAARHADTEAISVEVAAAVSAIPAVALLVISHLIVVMLMARRHGATPGTVDVNGDIHAGLDAEHRAALLGELDDDAVPKRAQRGNRSSTVGVGGSGAGLKRARSPRPRIRHSDHDLIAWIRAELATGRRVTGTDVAKRLNLSPATGRRRLQVLRANDPELAQLLSR